MFLIETDSINDNFIQTIATDKICAADHIMNDYVKQAMYQIENMYHRVALFTYVQLRYNK